MSSSWTSQCQEKKKKRKKKKEKKKEKSAEPQLISEMCPRKTRARCLWDLSPGLRQPPAVPLLALLRVATKWSPGASRGESHLNVALTEDGSDDQNLKNNRRLRRRRLHGPVKKAAMISRRKHFSDFAERSGASWRGQMINWMCEDAGSSGNTVCSYERNIRLVFQADIVPKTAAGDWLIRHRWCSIIERVRAKSPHRPGGERLNCDLLV